ALAQHHNVMAAEYFAAAMCGFIALFSIVHYTRLLYSRHASKTIRGSMIVRSQVASTRYARKLLNKPAPGFKSLGHLIVVVIYLGINITLAVTYVDYSAAIGPAKRFGWLAFCNIAFLTFLALKNTPLAFLTSHSYDTLNPLHQVAGYTAIFTAMLHVTLECVYFKKTHHVDALIEHEQIVGIVAALSMLIIFITALAMKKLRYEAFYIIHIVMFMVMIMTVAMHRPEFAKREIFIIIVSGAMWGADRILRACRIVWYSRNNQATIYPLPHGGTRIVLGRSPSRAIPGAHCFLWLPSIRKFETHPFTIVSKSPNLELVISAYDGFTSDLHEYAVKNPGASLRASVDGPYGALPDFSKVSDKIILISGGSGASFTFGVALDTIKKLPAASKTTIDFIWTVREQGKLPWISWFSKELADLQVSPRVSFFLHTTRPTPTHSATGTGTQTPTSIVSPSPTDEEKQMSFSEKEQENPGPISASRKTTHLDFGIEKKESQLPLKNRILWDASGLDVAHGRPDIKALIRDVVSRSSPDERIMIGACGPDSLMTDVRRNVTRAISVSGPSVEYHAEQFGW
ncbi:ferric reductase like transmembrane component, partial [Amylocarpus encephaloides]